MTCLFLFRTESKLKSLENIWKDNHYYHMIMPEEDNNILKYNKDKKSLKTPFVIHAYKELLLEKNTHMRY